MKSGERIGVIVGDNCRWLKTWRENHTPGEGRGEDMAECECPSPKATDDCDDCPYYEKAECHDFD